MGEMKPSAGKPELWGGLECTINRVGDRFLDQFALANLYAQPNSEAVAALGISKLRFPILWERHEPVQGAAIDWSFTESQLAFYGSKGIDIIATLVHHGSGPKFTDLLDPEFPALLAAYAAQVAARFPQLEYYTPVNEPLTTARFSGLYGLWYPHARDDKSFLRCLLNELKGTVLAMQAIRKVNPDAKLVQTEDLGKTYSTAALAYQARFENERRWLTFDILCGRLNECHRLWTYFLKHGILESELSFFIENACPPDICGFNYYVTSERFLDERLELYPQQQPGGNKRHRYVDVEAARVPLQEPTGLPVLLREASERTGLPMAVTEVHIHCHREEQLRWFRQVWSECCAAKEEGIDLRAVTTWAIMGSYGWNKLLTCEPCDYEAGAYDLRGGSARPTALARYLQQLNAAREDEHLAVANGWWLRDSRFLQSNLLANTGRAESRMEGRHILIIGKNGTLGQAFARICRERSLAYVLAGRTGCDIASPSSVAAALDELQPWAVVNAAGYVRVDDAEREREACFRENAEGPLQLALACSRRGIALATFSSDLVFDGTKEGGYHETDPVSPLNVYGASKARAEVDVLEAWPQALVIRTSAFFGPWDRYNFFQWVYDRLQAGQPVRVANDQLVSPTYVPDLVHTTLDLLIDREGGIRHLANKGGFSWADLAHMVADAARFEKSLIESVSGEELGLPARRPRNSVLDTVKGQLLPDAPNAFHRYFAAKTRHVELTD
ncbi:MAG: NAD-dependent epimerase/dehydratase family protein [Chitinophagaceae bacterium]|nr:MAG: NAD-dependent epimerase/dehydratase family protein [Chitinophagaceae bacterium]